MDRKRILIGERKDSEPDKAPCIYIKVAIRNGRMNLWNMQY